MREAAGDGDALPIVARDVRIVAREGGREPVAPQPRLASRPAVQAAAVAAGGFVAGAAVLGLVQRRNRAAATLARGSRRRALSRRTGAAPPAAAQTLQVMSSRAFLVDVHVLGTPGAE
jgi:hypothetical protein